MIFQSKTVEETNVSVICYFYFFFDIEIIRGLHDITCTETQNVSFEVELSHSGIDVIWHFKGQEIKAGPKYKIEARGKIYKLTVVKMMKDDEGEYVFYAGGKKTSGKLIVAG